MHMGVPKVYITGCVRYKHDPSACTQFYASQMNQKYVSRVSNIFLKFVVILFGQIWPREGLNGKISGVAIK